QRLAAARAGDGARRASALEGPGRHLGGGGWPRGRAARGDGRAGRSWSAGPVHRPDRPLAQGQGRNPIPDGRNGPRALRLPLRGDIPVPPGIRSASNLVVISVDPSRIVSEIGQRKASLAAWAASIPKPLPAGAQAQTK